MACQKMNQEVAYARNTESGCKVSYMQCTTHTIQVIPTENVIIVNVINFLISIKNTCRAAIEGLRAKRAYTGFLADFHFLHDRANFWQTELI